jgi:acyl dehydratase
MSGKILLEYEGLPSVLPSFIKAATTLGGGLEDGQTIPDIQARVSGVCGTDGRLQSYSQVCGFEQTGTLPMTYPHVLAFPLQLAVLSHREFPLKLLGLVHVRNSITQHQPMPAQERFDATVSVGGHQEANKGIEFEMLTRYANSQGECVWESSAVMLARVSGKGKRSGGRKEKKQTPEAMPEAGRWRAPADIGRRYGMAAGDMNPIHLSGISAKLFGFPRAIAHGMWLKARCAADLADDMGERPCTLSVEFKRPVFLPSEVVFSKAESAGGIDFALASPDGSVKHMQGRVNPADTD